jgi:oligopeptide transport system ATP-binding protein
MTTLLEVKNLRTTFKVDAGLVQAVRGISLHVDRGETLGIVGESGSGKSVSMLSVLRLLPDNARIEAESVLYRGEELTRQSDRYLRSLYGSSIGMIFQDPMTSLNPLTRVGRQVMEPLRLHTGASRAEARREALRLLEVVEIPDAPGRFRQYPHEFSGGMRQRAMIAMAIACRPDLLIADEPTTALDVTIQAQILELLTHLKEQLDTAIILITHNLGVVASTCSRVVVMYGGTIAEEGTTREIFYQARHPYTWGLLRSVPDTSDGARQKLVPIPGSPPDLIAPPPGCPFAPWCTRAMKICTLRLPQPFPLSPTHRAACWLTHPLCPGADPEVRA